VRPKGVVSFVAAANAYRAAVEAFALLIEDRDRSERGVLDSPTLLALAEVGTRQ